MTEIIEINNETDQQIKVSAYRSKTSGMLYIHIGERHGTEVIVEPQDYEQIEVKEVLC